MKYIMLPFLVVGALMANSPEQETQRYYNNNVDAWLKRYDIDSEYQTKWIPELREFKKLLPKGSVLDVGFGGGQEAAWFIKHGYQVSGVDITQGFVDALQKRFPKHLFKQGSADAIPFADNSFDGIWCSALLLHLSSEKLAAVFKEMHRVLKPGGVLFIATIEGDKVVQHKTGRWFFFHPEERLKSTVQKAGFSDGNVAILKAVGCEPWQQPWVTLFARKKKSS